MILSVIEFRDSDELAYDIEKFAHFQRRVREYDYSYTVFQEILELSLDAVNVRPEILWQEKKKRCFKMAEK